MKKKIVGAVAILLVLALAVTVGFGSSWYTNWNVKTWFDHWGKGGDPAEPDDETKNEAAIGGAFISGAEENGVRLTNAELPRAAYTANGVSEEAETAYVFTATVGSDNNAENTGVEWSVEWQNAASEWANGKAVTEYVTIAPRGDDYRLSKTATLTVLCPFGEQIVLTARAKEQSDIYASRTIDYAQRVTDFTVSFGEVKCNFGSTTNVTVQLSESGQVSGGMPNYKAEGYSEYTVATETEVEYTLSVSDPTAPTYWLESRYVSNMEPSPMSASEGISAQSVSSGGRYSLQFYNYTESGNYDTLTYAVLQNYSVAEKGLYFGIRHFVQNMGLTYAYSYGSAFPTIRNSCTIEDFRLAAGLYEESGYICYEKANDMFELTVTVRSKVEGVTYGSLSKKTSFRMENHVNTTVIDSIEIDRGNIIL